MEYDKMRDQMLASITEEELICYENEDYLVLNKPFDIQIDGSRPCTLQGLLERMRPEIKRVFFCHQLDYATSGCILIAKHKVAAQTAQMMFAQRMVQKEYWAWVRGELNAQSISLPILEKRYRCMVDEKGKFAHTDMEPMDVKTWKGERITLVRLFPHTGRRHQLRVHLAHIGNRILGDATYDDDSNLSRMMLHSQRIGLPDPVGIDVQCPCPFVDITLF